MAIGIVSSDEFNSELSRVSRTKGRSEGDVNVPDALRKVIGEESVINGRQAALQLANQFGISSSSVSAYANGATSTASYDKPKESIISHINKSRQRHIKKASRVLNDAISAITPDKLDELKARDLSGIARDMSAVIKNLEPPTPVSPEGESKGSVNFTIYAPQFRDERTFPVMKLDE